MHFFDVPHVCGSAIVFRLCMEMITAGGRHDLWLNILIMKV